MQSKQESGDSSTVASCRRAQTSILPRLAGLSSPLIPEWYSIEDGYAGKR